MAFTDCPAVGRFANVEKPRVNLKHLSPKRDSTMVNLDTFWSTASDPGPEDNSGTTASANLKKQMSDEYFFLVYMTP
jgi:hypothetical protein